MTKCLCTSLVLGIALSGCPVTLCTSFLAKAEVTLQKPADACTVTENEGRTVFLFTCPSGIGNAKVQLAEGFAPCRFNVGLRYASSEPFTRLEGFQVIAGDLEFLDPPRADGPSYLEVQMPDGAFASGITTLTIRWVDMYR
jgi:hypothetical protein